MRLTIVAGLLASIVAVVSCRPAYAYDPKASQIKVDASGFDGNLTSSDDTVQKIAQKLDDMTSISDYSDADARASISETISGIDYNNVTGVFSTTSGYAIPSTSSSTNWDSAYSNRIVSASGTAPLNLSVASNALSGSINNAAADGSTIGVATFAAADFNSSSGNISIDYTNGQAASGSAKGFLTASDWTTFNNKQPAGSYITASSVDTLTNKTFDANGTGNSISNVDLSSDVIGNLPVNKLNSGTGATSGTFWRGDGTWAAASGGIDGSGTTNQITYWVDSDTLGGLSTTTYPSLAELSYSKGVTSSIQSQIDGKQSSGNYITALTGDVTSAGPGSAVATIANDAVTYAKIQNVSATDRLLGRDTIGAGDTEELTVGGGIEFTGSGGIQRSALSGDVAASAGSGTTTIQQDSVALGTDTTGNYAAGDAEGGAATSGDSATSFFSSGTLETARLDANVKREGPTLVIDGGASVIATNSSANASRCSRVTKNITVTGWEIVSGDTGSVVIDVWKDSYANWPPTDADRIAGTEKPTLSSANKNQDLTLTTWSDTTFDAGEYICYEVESATTVTNVTLKLITDAT